MFIKDHRSSMKSRAQNIHTDVYNYALWHGLINSDPDPSSL